MKKLTIEFISAEFAKEGYTFLTTEYINNKQKLVCVCPNGHKCRVSFSHWKAGVRCKKCFVIRRSINGVFVKKELEKLNYTLITDEKAINNSKSMFVYKCCFGHVVKTSWAVFRLKYSCKICNLMKRDSFFRLSYSDVKKSFVDEGYVLLSTSYFNAFAKLDYVCSNGHKHSIRWNDWQQGCRCPTCANINASIRISGAKHHNWKGGVSCDLYCVDWTKEYKEYIKNRDGYKCLNPQCFNNDVVLSVHHVDYNKKNCIPSNLITLCRSCNTRANTDRKWHTNWYRILMNKRYGYKYN